LPAPKFCQKKTDISRGGNAMNLIDMLIKSVKIKHNNSVYKVVIL